VFVHVGLEWGGPTAHGARWVIMLGVHVGSVTQASFGSLLHLAFKAC
jgi:hypothetical protein